MPAGVSGLGGVGTGCYNRLPRDNKEGVYQDQSESVCSEEGDQLAGLEAVEEEQ